MKIIFVVIMLFSSSVYAQTPIKEANKYFSDISKSNIYELGEYYHPDALVEFRKMMEFLFKGDPEEQKTIVKQIFGVGVRPYELELMSDAEFLSFFIEYLLNARNNVSEVSIGDTHVIGEVFEGSNLAYVVTRTKGVVASYEAESYEVMRFRKHKGTWKALLDMKIKGFAIQIEAMFNGI